MSIANATFVPDVSNFAEIMFDIGKNPANPLPKSRKSLPP